jgi:outer membrane protein TolC
MKSSIKTYNLNMTPIKKYALLFLITIVARNAQAQEANATSFSLQQAIEYAVKNSPNYLNAELDLKSADYRRKEITGSGLPQISGSIDLKDYLDIPTSLLPAQIFGGPAGTFLPVKFGTKYNSSAGFSASQLIFSSDYIFGLKAAKEFMNLSKINVTRSKADLVSQVSKAYYSVLINRDRIKLMEANIVRLKKVFDDTKALNQQGFMELIDVERLEVQYNNLISEKDKIVRLISLSETLLKFQMGYKLSDNITLTDVLDVNSEQFEDLSVSKIDVTKRPEFQLLQAQQTLYDLDVKRLKWGYLPTLAAYGSFQYNAQRSKFNFLDFDKNDVTKQWYKVSLIGVTLNMNIFTGFQRVNRLEQAKITALKNQNNINNMALAAEMEANVASTSYSNAYASLLIQKKNMDLAQHVYDVAQKKYQSGVGSNLEIVTAETSLKEAQTNYFNATYDMLVAKIDYQKSIGTLVK